MKHYKVRLNGKELEIYPARVSAMPYNQVFAGAQRPLEQTEEAYFVTADLTGKATLEIEVEEAFQNYEIRPLAYDLADHRNGQTVTLTVDRPMQFTFEADGYHHALHVFLNPPVKKPEGEVIYYGKGEHHAGLIWLTSGQTLYLEEGAVVHGVIYAKDASDIHISGRGILDSSLYRRGDDYGEGGREVYEELLRKGIDPQEKNACYHVSNMIFYNCKNVQVEGIILRDAMLWSVIVRNHCENVVLDNIKLIGHWRYNSDGIDICASKNVTVKNSFIRSFDDCFVARAPYLQDEYEDVENVTVKNCVMWCDWGKSLEIWCGFKPCAVKNIHFEDIYLIRLNMTAINITTWFGSEQSLVENVVYKNIWIDRDCKENRMSPAIDTKDDAGYHNDPDYQQTIVHIGPEKLGKRSGHQGCIEPESYEGYHVCYRNILFEHVHGAGADPRIQVSENNEYTEIYGICTKDCDFTIQR